jgi:hypothetical protein
VTASSTTTTLPNGRTVTDETHAWIRWLTRNHPQTVGRWTYCIHNRPLDRPCEECTGNAA